MKEAELRAMEHRSEIYRKWLWADVYRERELAEGSLQSKDDRAALLAYVRQLEDLNTKMAQDGSDAFDLGKQVGRGEIIRAYDEAMQRLYDGQLLGDIRAALVAAGESVTLPCERLRQQNAELAAVLKQVEWAEHNEYHSCCPTCAGPQDEGHRDTCRLAKALRGGGV